MGIWERIEELVDDACGFESHGQVLVAENDAEFDGCRARVAELNALGLPTRTDRWAGAAAAGCRRWPRAAPAVVSRRWRGRSGPNHHRIPPQGSRAWRNRL
jgi:hypothetical protein